MTNATDTALLREQAGRFPHRPAVICGERLVTFVGRLGSYRYLDMDVTIGEALTAADGMLKRISEGAAIPTFFAQPLTGH